MGSEMCIRDRGKASGSAVGQDDDIDSIPALGPFFHVVRSILRHVVQVAASTASVRPNSVL